MKKITSQLAQSVKNHLNWSKWRADCFSQLLIGLLTVCTVNLKVIALCFSGTANADSHYRRIQRFFSEFQIDFDLISRWLFQLFFNSNKKIYLIIDRTNWFWGKTKINVFMCSIAYEGIAIPILWTLLPKAGTSSAYEQISLVNRFIQLFGSHCIQGLLADREFANAKLFKYCTQQNIPFYIRIKNEAAVRIKRKKIVDAYTLFNTLPRKATCMFPMVVEIFGQKVYLSASRSHTGEWMIIATNQPDPQAAAVYCRRWEIESLFQSLKGRGFQFESTRLLQPQRLEKLIALLVIAFAWAHKIGEWHTTIKPMRFKHFHNSSRPQHSFFRLGLDFIRQLTFKQQLDSFFKKFLRCIFHPFNQHFLIPPCLSKIFHL